MLVEADSPEEAFDIVESALSDENPRWSDWHEASGAHTKDFAGRYSNAIFFTPNKNGEPDPDAEIANHLCYADEPALAELVIEKFLQFRLNDIRNYKSKAIDLSTYAYDPYTKSWDMDLYGTKKLAQLLDDEWTPDTAIYDLTDWTANLRSFVERVKANPTKQYLIPVDFHF
jgi:hypothetical protein